MAEIKSFCMSFYNGLMQESDYTRASVWKVVYRWVVFCLLKWTLADIEWKSHVGHTSLEILFFQMFRFQPSVDFVCLVL